MCYLCISRDQLCSVFSLPLTYLARALVMFLFFSFFLASLQGCIIQNFAWSFYHVTRAQVMVASPKCPKILLLLSSAHATIGGEQMITQMKYMWNKFNYASVIDYVCKFLLSVFYCSGAK